MRRSVPALAVATFARGNETAVALGCRPDDRFRVASITKPLTALLALGLLDPDEPTGVWPPDVRVRHLLSHTSGFDCELPERDLARFGDGDGALTAAVAELPGVRRFLRTGRVWSYANTGYWLAGHLAAAGAGCPYEDALAERVLDPFGLESTSFGEPDLEGTGADAGEGPYPRARRPSGGLVSTAGDLLRAGRRLLAEPLFAAMRAVHGRPIGGVYGLGLFGEVVAGTRVWSHPGSYGGFQASLLLVPSHEAVFVGLTNSTTGGRALREVEDAFFEQVLGAGRRRPAFVSLPPALLETYTGTYANADETIEVRAGPGGIVVATAEGERLLRAVGSARFEAPDGPFEGERADFPRAGLVRLGSRIAERVA